MKCKFCGNEVAEDAVTCSACGAKLKAQVKMAATQNVVSTVKESQETENFVNTTTEKTEAENFVSSSEDKFEKKFLTVGGVINILSGIGVAIGAITGLVEDIIIGLVIGIFCIGLGVWAIKIVK